MLPRVKIYFENGNLGLVAPSPDGVMGIITTGQPVGGTFYLSTPYQLFKFSDLIALQVTNVTNPHIVKIVKEFYDQAGEGTELWLMAFPDTVKLSDMVDSTVETYGKKLVDAANGKLRGIFISRKPADNYSFTPANGVDPDVTLAITKAQAFAEYYTTTKYAPLFVVVEAYGYTGNPTELTDLTTLSNNRVAVMIGNTVIGGKNAAIGVLAGRLAASPVQRNIGRFRDGSLKIVKGYIAGTLAELVNVTPMHDKGYITFRTFVNQAGYYFNDDFTATLPTDDYCHLTARRTIDKAYRIAYTTLLNYLLDEVELTEQGTLQVGFVKSVEADVEAAIAKAMTAKGELSGDITNGDKGVVCFIDENQNIASTSTLQIRIRVRPFGYPRYIDVYLGFTVMS